MTPVIRPSGEVRTHREPLGWAWRVPGVLRFFDWFSEWAVNYAMRRVQAATDACDGRPLCPAHQARVDYWFRYALQTNDDRMAVGLRSVLSTAG